MFTKFRTSVQHRRQNVKLSTLTFERSRSFGCLVEVLAVRLRALTVVELVLFFKRFLSDTPGKALPYWRLVAKYPYLLLCSMLCGPQSSEAKHPHQLFSARWFLVVQWVSSSQLVVAVQRRWHDGGLSLGPSAPSVQRTSDGRTSLYRKLINDNNNNNKRQFI